jgi:hypothetical protein
MLMVAWTYNALSYEEPIAYIEFNELELGSHNAILQNGAGELIGSFEILGDQWRIDAKFIKMKYWANLLGLDSRYALERIEGRYSKIADQNNSPNLAHDLGEDGVIELFTIWGWNPFIDANYGSSTYFEISTDKRYSVTKTQTGIIVRSEPLAADSNEKSFVVRAVDAVKGALR